jgi:hypothetical protein
MARELAGRLRHSHLNTNRVSAPWLPRRCAIYNRLGIRCSSIAG